MFNNYSEPALNGFVIMLEAQFSASITPETKETLNSKILLAREALKKRLDKIEQPKTFASKFESEEKIKKFQKK